MPGLGVTFQAGAWPKHKPLWPTMSRSRGIAAPAPCRERRCCLGFPMCKQTGTAEKIKASPELGVQGVLSQGTPVLGVFASSEGPLSCPFSAARRMRAGTAASPPHRPGPLGSSPAPGPSTPDLGEGFPYCLHRRAALRPLTGQTGTHWPVPRAFCAYKKQRSFQSKPGAFLLPPRAGCPQTGCNPAPQRTSYTQSPARVMGSFSKSEQEPPPLPFAPRACNPMPWVGDPCAPRHAFKPLACLPASSSPLPKGFAVAGSLRRPSSVQPTAPLPLQQGQEQSRGAEKHQDGARWLPPACPSRARPPRWAQLSPACGSRIPHPSQHPQRQGIAPPARPGRMRWHGEDKCLSRSRAAACPRWEQN